MRLYLDTEFNGHGGELISMALVGIAQFGGDPPQWYRAREISSPTDNWVFDNVMPKLETSILDPRTFRQLFIMWVSQFKDPEIICDWHADAAHFCKMLEGPDYTQSIDFPCRITILKTPPGQPVSAKPHNALADAIALRDWHNALDPVKENVAA